MTKISLNAQKVSQMKLRDTDMSQFSSNKQYAKQCKQMDK